MSVSSLYLKKKKIYQFKPTDNNENIYFEFKNTVFKCNRCHALLYWCPALLYLNYCPFISKVMYDIKN